MFIRQDGEITFTPGDISTSEVLENRNYTLDFHPEKGFYLTESDAFELPEKMYGGKDIDTLTERYLASFRSRSGNTGVILNGLKGTGKSVMAKNICVKAEVPVIMLTAPYNGTGFNNFIDNIKQECIIFVDEFEKVYRKVEDQQSLLTLMDGTGIGKKIFLLTSNNTGNLIDPLNNRPSRILFRKDYSKLEDSVIKEIFDDKADDKSNWDEFMLVTNIIGEPTMDIVTSLIGECNIHKETPIQAIAHLNIKPQRARYDIFIEWMYNPNRVSPGGLSELLSDIKSKGGDEDALLKKHNTKTLHRGECVYSSVNPFMSSNNDFEERYVFDIDGKTQYLYVEAELGECTRTVSDSGNTVVFTAKTDKEDVRKVTFRKSTRGEKEFSWGGE